jgi:hypothetical protein
MKTLKKTLRWFLIISFIILASIGLGINGAISVVDTRKREPENEAKIEQVDKLGTASDRN